MKKKPYYSVITINRNNSAGLDLTIRSVIEQTFDNFEFLVIDGASTDNSLDIIRLYSDKIDYYISESDNGIYHAMNKGIRQAKGEYCIFLNSGDFFYSSTTLTELFDTGRTEDILYGNILIDDHGKKFKGTSPDIISFDYLYVTSLHHPASIIRRKLLLDAGLFSEEYRYVSDWAFFIDALFLLNCSYSYVDQIIAIFNCDGVSSDASNNVAIRDERISHLQKKYKNMYISMVDRAQKKSVVYALEHPNSKVLSMICSILDCTKSLRRNFLKQLPKRKVSK